MINQEANELRESKPCCICNADQHKEVYQWPANYYSHQEFETASWDGRQSLPLSIVKCSSCQMVYTRPSFKLESLSLVYPDDIVPPEIKPDVVLKSTKWQAIIDEMKLHLPEGASACDIGTRYGVLVKQLADAGFKSWGVEYNPIAVQKSVELGVSNVFVGVIADIAKICKEQSFSNVNAFVMDDVLEHLVHPLEDLKVLASVQKSGDFVFARQMDWNSLGHKLYGKKWYYLQPGAHMYFFNADTASKLFDAAGYDIVAIRKASLKTNLRSIFQLAITRVKKLMGRGPIWKINGKEMYLAKRGKLSDMFLVVARKR